MKFTREQIEKACVILPVVAKMVKQLPEEGTQVDVDKLINSVFNRLPLSIRKEKMKMKDKVIMRCYDTLRSLEDNGIAEWNINASISFVTVLLQFSIHTDEGNYRAADTPEIKAAIYICRHFHQSRINLASVSELINLISLLATCRNLRHIDQDMHNTLNGIWKQATCQKDELIDAIIQTIEK